MYIPERNKKEDIEEIKDFLSKNAFGILINQVAGRSWATHIPLEFEADGDGNDTLVGHIAKVNPQWKGFTEDEEVLCIFNGPHAYISSSWYKKEEVPTWNYIAVHIYGKLKILNEEEVMASLHRLVAKYEASSKNPVSLKIMSPNTLRQVKGMVGFKIEITDIQAKYKLSQNREQDHPKIISELEDIENSGSHEIANHMKNIGA